MSLLNTLTSTVQRRPAARVGQLPPDFMKGIVDGQDRIPERMRTADQGFLHVSSMIDFCARRLALLRAEDRPMVQSVTGGHRVMWRIGRAVETHIREQFIAGRHRQGIIGNWGCLCGATTRRGTYPGDLTCRACATKLDTYGEFTLRDDEARIMGNPDILFQNGPEVVVTEIKSMNADQFNDLKQPLGDHVFQAGWYHDLLSSHGFRPHRHAIIFYCNKVFKFGSPYKEFHIDMMDPSLVAQRQRVRSQVVAAWQEIDAQRLPAREACGSPVAFLAKRCPVVASCFNRTT